MHDMLSTLENVDMQFHKLMKILPSLDKKNQNKQTKKKTLENILIKLYIFLEENLETLEDIVILGNKI